MGTWEITVFDGITRQSELDSDFDSLTATGEFVLIPIRVQNNDVTETFFFFDLFAVLDGDSTPYHYDDDVESSVYKETGMWLQRVPGDGGTIDGLLVFDVPADVTITSLYMDVLFDYEGDPAIVNLGEV